MIQKIKQLFKSKSKKGRIAIYTAIYGNTDTLIDPHIVPENCDFYCFTDRTDFKSDVYKIIHTPARDSKSNNLSAKYFKVSPHELFPEYEYSVWIDGRGYTKHAQFADFVKDLLKDSNIALYKHPQRETIWQEAEECIVQKKDKEEVIREQIQAYKNEGYEQKLPLVACTLIVRRHNAPEVIEFNKQWWEQINQYSLRDQLSFPYVADKLDLNVKIIPGEIYNNKFVKFLRYSQREQYLKNEIELPK